MGSTTEQNREVTQMARRPITVLAQFSMGDASFEEIEAEVAEEDWGE